ncbi:MAG: 30S ribosomal protein S9 [bacterium]|nr:30S ribosomal protein S9 [bacterium]
MPQDGSFYGTGRRKSSVARVWLFPGKGRIIMNNLELKDYICRETLVDVVLSPLRILKLDGKYDVKIFSKGGGLTGQAGAAQMGLARAILCADENFRKALREHSFLSRDTRIKERKKYGKRGARKGPQYRKR